MKNPALYLLSFLLLLSVSGYTQQTKNDWEKFISKGYDLLDSCSGDLNKDNIADKVLVLYNEKLESDPEKEIGRKLIILFKEGSGWKKVVETDKVIMCKSCGGVFGDPFAAIAIKNNVLVIDHYGGSNWRWASTHRFRFQNGAFYLIGKTHDYSWNVERCETLDAFLATEYEDENLVTGQYVYKKMDEKVCKWLKNEKGKRPVKPLQALANFDISK